MCVCVLSREGSQEKRTSTAAEETLEAETPRLPGRHRMMTMKEMMIIGVILQRPVSRRSRMASAMALPALTCEGRLAQWKANLPGPSAHEEEEEEERGGCVWRSGAIQKCTSSSLLEDEWSLMRKPQDCC